MYCFVSAAACLLYAVLVHTENNYTATCTSQNYTGIHLLTVYDHYSYTYAIISGSGMCDANDRCSQHFV